MKWDFENLFFRKSPRLYILVFYQGCYVASKISVLGLSVEKEGTLTLLSSPRAPFSVCSVQHGCSERVKGAKQEDGCQGCHGWETGRLGGVEEPILWQWWQHPGDGGGGKGRSKEHLMCFER